MKVVAYVRGNDSRTNERVRHFGEALQAEFRVREDPVDCDLAIQAGFQISPAIRHAMDNGTPIIILENPVWHYGDKMATYTFGYNGLNGLAFVPESKFRPARPKPELEPWIDPFSGQITVFGQVEHDKALRGADIYEWVDWVRTVCPAAIFREHPVMVDTNHDDVGCFEECMAATSLAITYSSTVGAEAVIRGIPTVAFNEGALAYPMATHGLGDAPITPSRAEWLHGLSYRHWSLDEEIDTNYILSGYEEARNRAERGEYDNMSNGRDQ